ncbi:uncharacterized protein LTR77_002127 [Saxophila tyrrhenica]|uniref:Zn(2)-C6 fungal-type domain-containing protein n=1 Tax=Saxophila tyrrhenica TaxID=1690608 RepID=A0AAV9PMI1_9PEZI|nr:hypothetical protein LTR77_002127 [Saxophila tyrrhenica]
MPTRSPGCFTCRKRKIRCDEERPGCKRCETHGVPCPGYRVDKPGGIEFKDQTTVTKQKADEQYRVKQAIRTATDHVVRTNGLASPSDTLIIINDDLSTTEAGSWSAVDARTPASPGASAVLGLDGLSSEQQAVVLASSKAAKTRSKAISSLHINAPLQLYSPDLERASLYSAFIDLYLPQIAGSAQNGHFSFFQTIAEKRSTQPALQQSLDSLCLVQIGSLYKDQALLKQAVRQYGSALSSLARSIAKGQFLYDDDVLAAVTVLATCELFEEISKMGEGWGKHVQGSNQLVALRGPNSMQSDLALLLYSNMRHGSLIHALIARKAPFMATPEWREVAFRVPKAVQDASTNFYDLAIQIPGLLERHDALDLDSQDALETLDAILADSADLEDAMRDWFAAWQALGTLTSDSPTPYYSLRPIEEFPWFCTLCPDRTFAEAYVFPDFLVAYLHSLYWMVMHYLRTNTQSLQKQRHRLDIDWYPSGQAVVQEDELLGYILNLCRCIPFFVEPGHWEWLKWIGAVRNSVFVRGLAPPNVSKESRTQRVSPEPG